MSDTYNHETCVRELMNSDRSMSELDARRIVMLSPPQSLVAIQKQAEERMAREERERQAAEFAASPEGRLAVALAAQKAADERTEKAKAARILLADEQGIPREALAQMDDATALDLAGIEPKPAPAFTPKYGGSRMVSGHLPIRRREDKNANDLEANLERLRQIEARKSAEGSAA